MSTLCCAPAIRAPSHLPSKREAAAVNGSTTVKNSLVLPQCRRGFNGVMAMRASRRSLVVCMAPEEEKMTRRSPLDFPIEWERPKPGRRPDIFPQFSPMKTPLPPPLPADPPEEDEEEEEEKKEEEEEDPEKEEPENPDKQ